MVPDALRATCVASFAEVLPISEEMARRAGVGLGERLAGSLFRIHAVFDDEELSGCAFRAGIGILVKALEAIGCAGETPVLIPVFEELVHAVVGLPGRVFAKSVFMSFGIDKCVSEDVSSEICLSCATHPHLRPEGAVEGRDAVYCYLAVSSAVIFHVTARCQIRSLITIGARVGPLDGVSKKENHDKDNGKSGFLYRFMALFESMIQFLKMMHLFF